MERKHGRARRGGPVGRGVVSEENLQRLRQRGASYLVGMPRAQLKAYERRLLEGDWQSVSCEAEVQLIAQDCETYMPGEQPGAGAKRKRGAFPSHARSDPTAAPASPCRLKRPGESSSPYGPTQRALPASLAIRENQHRRLVLELAVGSRRATVGRQPRRAYLLRANLEGSDPVKLWTKTFSLQRSKPSSARSKAIWPSGRSGSSPQTGRSPRIGRLPGILAVGGQPNTPQAGAYREKTSQTSRNAKVRLNLQNSRPLPPIFDKGTVDSLRGVPATSVRLLTPHEIQLQSERQT